MLDWNSIRKEYDEILEKLTGSKLDKRERVELQKRRSQLSDMLGAHDVIHALGKNIEENKELAKQEEYKSIAAEENVRLEKELVDAERNLENLLYPADERDERLRLCGCTRHRRASAVVRGFITAPIRARR